MRINLKEGSLEATLTESGATLLRFRLITAYDEQKVRDAQNEAQAAKDRAATRLAEFDASGYSDAEIAGFKERIVADIGRPLTDDESAGIKKSFDTIEHERLQGYLDRAAAEADRCWHLQPYGHYFCLEGRQINAAIQMLRGRFKAPNGEVGLADGYRHVRFCPDGIRIYEQSEQVDIYFPGKVLANAIDAVMHNLKTLSKYDIARTVNEARPIGVAKSFSADLALTHEFIRNLERGYAPWVEWAYADYDGIEGYPPMWRKISEDRQDARVSDATLAQALDGLERVAQSYSNGKVGDGKPVLIHLSYDSCPGDTPASYYWWIETAEGKQGMNGGLIAHQKYVKNGEEKIEEWGYSSHT